MSVFTPLTRMHGVNALRVQICGETVYQVEKLEVDGKIFHKKVRHCFSLGYITTVIAALKARVGADRNLHRAFSVSSAQNAKRFSVLVTSRRCKAKYVIVCCCMLPRMLCALWCAKR